MCYTGQLKTAVTQKSFSQGVLVWHAVVFLKTRRDRDISPVSCCADGASVIRFWWRRCKPAKKSHHSPFSSCEILTFRTEVQNYARRKQLELVWLIGPCLQSSSETESVAHSDQPHRDTPCAGHSVEASAMVKHWKKKAAIWGQ